jgi:hypothetical protein
VSRFATVIGPALLLLGGLACKTELDTAAIDALVAPKHAYKLRFETREVTTGLEHQARYTVAVPRGWKYEAGKFRPTNEKLHGRSSMKLRTSCEECRLDIKDDFRCSTDTCIPEDWGAILEARFAKSNRNFIHNEVTKNRRIVISREQSSGVVEVYWWADGAPYYHACIASLDEHLVDSAPAFAKACELAMAH